MEVRETPLLELPVLNKLISDYLSGNEELKSFHAGAPSIQQIQQLSGQRSIDPETRQTLVDVLHVQYRDIEIHEKVRENINSLTDEDTYTITTGHQICLLSGPFFSILKIASCINLAAKLTRETDGARYVPVFWMATEDHDFEEMNHVNIRGEKISWNCQSAGAVGRLDTTGLKEFMAQVEDKLFPDVAASELWKKVKQAYASNNLADATRRMANELFGSHGLVILDADDQQLKQLFTPVMEQEIFGSSSEAIVNSTSERLVIAGYKAQVTPREINLFYLTDTERLRIVKENDGYKTVDGKVTWSADEIRAELRSSPEQFSPNVILRPVYQECILPNVAYIGGPGELSYWLQLKDVFDQLKVPFPALILRSMAMPITPPVKRKIEQLGIAFDEVFKDFDELSKAQVQSEVPSFEEETKKLGELFNSIGEKLSQIDPNLSRSVEAEHTKAQKQFENLVGKGLRAAKKNNEDTLDRIRFVLDQTSPNGVPAERVVNVFELVGYFGNSMVDELIRVTNPLNSKYLWLTV